MISAVVSKELKIISRSGASIGIALALFLLLAAAAALSVQRMATFEREREAAAALDRRVWDAQGERNPHSAAHFSRYAFKPAPALAAFDPGVSDYAGLAVWMEAHYQNPAVFRRAEDLGDTGRVAALTSAFVLQLAAPLFLFLILFASIAGEREDGTFRQAVAAGIPGGRLLRGKLAAAGLGAIFILAPAIAAALFISFRQTGGTVTDIGVRSAGLAGVYLIYLTAAGALAVGVSALFRSRRGALFALLGIWSASFVLAPRFAADASLFLYPEPDAATLNEELAAASRAYYQDSEYREREDRRILAEYGVSAVEELPINYGAFTLQSSEEHAHPLFEAFYAKQDAIHARQEHVLKIASLVSPLLAVSDLSAGLAGTDRLHHKAFARDAETHRRAIVKRLNDDLMYNAGDAGYGYKADEALWREIEDFSHSPPRFLDIAPAYAFSAIVLIAWLVGALLFAEWAVARASRRIAQS